MNEPTNVADTTRAYAATTSGKIAERLARLRGETSEERQAFYESERRAHFAELAEMAATRNRYRRNRYEDARPADYATAELTQLHPQQDPGGRGTGFLRSEAKNALIIGPSGHGKSHLAYAIGNAAVDHGLWVEAWSVLELVQVLAPLPKHARGDEERSRRQENTLEWAKVCDLLILDDLGPEEATGFTAERWRAQLLDILTARDGDPKRRTVVTLNGGTTADQPTDEAKAKVRKDAAALVANRYTARVATRLQRDCLGIWVEGECLRKAATWDPFS